MAKNFVYVDSNGLFSSDSSVFEVSDFLDVSAGAGDAGKPVKLDAGGQIDASMINDGDIDHTQITNIGTNSHSDIDTHIDDDSIHFTEGSIDHGSIGGLGDDDHTQYTLADGTRDFSGVVAYGSQPSFNDDLQIVSKKYVDDLVESHGVFYSAGTGGVTKGDLVYISADDTVLPLSDITSGEFGVGLALTTVGAASSVGVSANDNVLAGVLTTATAGDKYFWTGSGFSNTIPITASAYVWQVGVAKNATDLHVDIRQIKRNAA